MASTISSVTIENANIGFLNFSGTVSQFNPAGDRTFSIFLEEDQGEELAKIGWNVKRLKPRGDDPDDPGRMHLPVKVSFKVRPPKIVVISETNRTQLDENMCFSVDSLDMASVDLTINPSVWELNGKSGVKAYLGALYITLEENPLTAKYGI